ncbi:MAG: PorP/SprF family type IX secretion system membrane protein [Fimbriimonadaceae bacterium]|nr:PorP/SprF family type IX secretion system membrane protein [Chitinophagales bacterium]
MRKVSAYFLILITSISFSAAQDIHFTQFYAAPLEMNPANTGLFNGNIRGVINYRNQWQSFAPYNTFAGSVDYNFGQNFLENDLIGVGVSFISDVAGDAEFSTTQGNISVSYIKTLGNKFSRNYLSAGFYGGLAQRTINTANMTFGSQYNGYSYDPNITSGETIAFNDFSFVDLGGGVNWLFVPEDRFNVYSGVAFHHVNQPNQSFGSVNENLYMRITGTLGAQIPISEKVDMVPGILTQVQGPHYEFMGGLNFKYYMQTRASNETAFSIGAWHRMGIDNELGYKSDASAIAFRYDFLGLSAGLSYDINISGLRDASNSLGGPELSLIYTAALPHRDRKVDCPKF